MERRSAQKDDVALFKGESVQDRARRIDIPGREAGYRVRRRVRPEPLDDKAIHLLMRKKEPFERRGPLTRKGRHDLDVMPSRRHVGRQFIDEDRSAAEIRQEVHGMD